MADQPPMPPTTEDFPNHWGFYLLQGINRLGDKVDDVGREQERSIEALRQEISGVRRELGEDIIGVRDELRHKINRVQQELGHDLIGVRDELRHEVSGVRQELGQDIIGMREELRHEVSGVRLEMGGLREEIRQEIGEVRLEVHALDTKVDRKLTTLQFWYWSTLVVIIVGFAKLLDTHL